MATTTGRGWLRPGSVISIAVALGIGGVFLAIAVSIVSNLDISWSNIWPDAWKTSGETRSADGEGALSFWRVLSNARTELLASTLENPLLLVLVFFGSVALLRPKTWNFLGTNASIILAILMWLGFLGYLGFDWSDGNGQENDKRQTALRSAAPPIGQPDWVTVSFEERTRIAKLPGRCVTVAKEWSHLVNYQNQRRHIELSLREPGPPQDIFINKYVPAGTWWGGYQCPHA